MRRSRENCPIRHENGNCLCVGGFCTAVPDPVCAGVRSAYESGWTDCALKVRKEQRLKDSSTIEAEPVRHGRWILEAHKERVNYRWNVTAECSECCDEKNEIYAGFFPGVPDCLAKDVILDIAKSVKLSNYCPNCGAKMDGDRHDQA